MGGLDHQFIPLRLGTKLVQRKDAVHNILFSLSKWVKKKTKNVKFLCKTLKAICLYACVCVFVSVSACILSVLKQQSLVAVHKTNP